MNHHHLGIEKRSCMRTYYDVLSCRGIARLIGEFYPKGRNLSLIAPAILKRNLVLLNARPHKVLNLHSARELWDFELRFCCT